MSVKSSEAQNVKIPHSAVRKCNHDHHNLRWIDRLNPRNRRIVIDGRRLVAGRTGVGRYLECLLSEWCRSELPAQEVVVALADSSGFDFVPKVAGLKAELLTPKLPGLLWERFGLSRLLRPDDLLFAPTNLVPWGWKGQTVLVMFDALQELRPGDFPQLLRWRFGARYRWALERADRLIVPSEATARDLVRIYGVESNRLIIIHPAPDHSFRPLLRDDPIVLSARKEVGLEHHPFFLFVGKKSRRRNVDAIFEAFRTGRPRFAGHRLVFVGAASDQETEYDSRSLGVFDIGHVSEPVLRGLMASATALLYPSECEGFGLPIVEAMASGCPVITLRRDALIEAGGDAPLYLESADPAVLADAMDEMANNQIARNDRIAAGIKAALRFSPNAFADAVKHELRCALGESSVRCSRGKFR